MTQDFTAFVGTVGIGGSGIWRSVDGGETWTVPKGIRDEFNCCALAVDPRNPDLVYAGLRDGIYRSEDRGVNFHRINCPINAYAVWSVAVDPSDSDTIFAGCRPGAVFRSSDGGERWEKLPVEFAPEGLFGGAPRVLAVAVDPTDSSMVWAGVEADGVRLSTDGGETWKRVGDRQIDSDIHGIAISPGSPSLVFVNTEWEVYRSGDAGETWTAVGAAETFSMPYCRGVAVKPGHPDVVFVGNGDSDIGKAGTLHRSTDRGESWMPLPLPVPPNSPIGYFATNSADPDLILCHSNYGQVYASHDGGDNWRKLPREFSEIRSIAWAQG